MQMTARQEQRAETLGWFWAVLGTVRAALLTLLYFTLFDEFLFFFHQQALWHVRAAFGYSGVAFAAHRKFQQMAIKFRSAAAVPAAPAAAVSAVAV